MTIGGGLVLTNQSIGVAFEDSGFDGVCRSNPKLPFIHRDLSWLQFNDRVLAEAKLRTNPILERLKFLSISASNLNEFFIIRFPSLLKSIKSPLKKIRSDGVFKTNRMLSCHSLEYRQLIP